MGKSDIGFHALTLILLLFSRLAGFFVCSPLFNKTSFSILMRVAAALACSLLIAPPLSLKFQFTVDAPSLLIIYVLKEIAIGYIVGFIFSLLVEAGSFAGELIGTAMGLSATELFTPNLIFELPLLSRFFSFFIFVLFFTLDMHHAILRLLIMSFDKAPISPNLFSPNSILQIIEMSGLLFQQALGFALFPMTILLALILFFALVSRFLPIFWIGFPLQLLLGLFVVGVSLNYFEPFLKQYFFQLGSSLKKFIVNY